MEPIRLHLNARREHVFAAWTRPELLVRWWGPDAQAEVDLRVGGRYRLSMQFEWGALVCVREYREIVPPERLVFTFAWEGDPSGEETRVTLLFCGRWRGAPSSSCGTGASAMPGSRSTTARAGWTASGGWRRSHRPSTALRRWSADARAGVSVYQKTENNG